MLTRFFPGILRHHEVPAVCLALLFALQCGCGVKEPPLSPAAKTFKSKIQAELQMLTSALVQPVVKGDREAMHQALVAGLLKAEQAGGPVPSVAAILDPNGFVLLRYPPDDGPVKQFSDYRSVKEVAKTRQIAQEVLYLADGSQVFVVLAPLLSENNLVGMVALAFSAAEVQDKSQVSGEEFRAINFNT